VWSTYTAHLHVAEHRCSKRKAPNLRDREEHLLAGLMQSAKALHVCSSCSAVQLSLVIVAKSDIFSARRKASEVRSPAARSAKKRPPEHV